MKYFCVLFEQLHFVDFSENMQIGLIWQKKYLKIFETTEPMSSKLGWDSPWFVSSQNHIQQTHPPPKMVTITKNIISLNSHNCCILN